MYLGFIAKCFIWFTWICSFLHIFVSLSKDNQFDMFVVIPWLQSGPTGSPLSVLGSDKPPEKVSEREGQENLVQSRTVIAQWEEKGMYRGETRPGNPESTRNTWRTRFGFKSFKGRRLERTGSEEMQNQPRLARGRILRKGPSKLEQSQKWRSAMGRETLVPSLCMG